MTPAVRAAQAAGVAHQLLEYDHDPAAASYGEEAAARLGLQAAHVFKTLVVKSDSGRLAVALVPVIHSLDLKAAATALGVRKLELAPVTEAERATGYVVGGISPLGQRRELPTVVDASALELPTMYVSAGRRGLELALAPADLLRLTRGITAQVAR